MTDPASDPTSDPTSQSAAPTDPADESRIDHRAQLLPEEEAVGSDDPEAQAEVILADSDDRTERREETMRESHQTPQ